MDVTIAAPLVVPDQPLAVSALEQRVEERGCQVMRQVMATARVLQTSLRPAGVCPACDAAESRPAGGKARRIETVFGSETLPRQRRR